MKSRNPQKDEEDEDDAKNMDFDYILNKKMKYLIIDEYLFIFKNNIILENIKRK